MTFNNSSGTSFTSNGNQTARPVVRGASLAHRTKLTASQKAVLVADIDDGITPYQPTQSALAKEIGVSIPMVWRAKRLSLLARQHVRSGAVTIGHYLRQTGAKAKPSISIVIAPANLDTEDEAILRAIIKRRGVNHVLDVAAAVEAAQ